MTLIETVPNRPSELLLQNAADIALMAQPTRFDPNLHVMPVYTDDLSLRFRSAIASRSASEFM